LKQVLDAHHEGYEQFLEKSKNEIKSLESELITIVKSQCSTYGEAKKFLIAKKKIAMWDGDLVFAEIIEDVMKCFDNEKNGLSVK
jgi:hypothetical protein